MRLAAVRQRITNLTEVRFLFLPLSASNTTRIKSAWISTLLMRVVSFSLRTNPLDPTAQLNSFARKPSLASMNVVLVLLQATRQRLQR